MKAQNLNKLYFLFGLLLLGGCKEGLVFDQNLALPEREWHWKEKAHFEVAIDDTTQWYSLFVNTRITGDYPYSNMWVLVQGISPSGDTSTARVELTLFNPDGTPLGLARGTVWEYHLPVIPQMDFTESGLWLFSIEQNMRVHTLPGVLDVGLSLEKAGEKF